MIEEQATAYRQSRSGVAMSLNTSIYVVTCPGCGHQEIKPMIALLSCSQASCRSCGRDLGGELEAGKAAFRKSEMSRAAADVAAGRFTPAA